MSPKYHTLNFSTAQGMKARNSITLPEDTPSDKVLQTAKETAAGCHACYTFTVSSPTATRHYAASGIELAK